MDCSNGSTLPTWKECCTLMHRFEMLPNIVEHSLTVGRVAEYIIEELTLTLPAEIIPDKDLVIAGALLHDIAKTKCLVDNCRHADAGADICTELGYPEIAEIVREHVYLKEYSTEKWRSGVFKAKEIVFYADKRVKHEKIVTLADRLAYIIDHYGKKDPHLEELISQNFDVCIHFEQALFKHISSSPEKLLQAVNTKI